MDTLKRYISEITESLKINDFNLKDVQLKAPGMKHFWAARLINHKIELEQLKKKKKKLKAKLVELITDNAPIKQSMSALDKSIEDSPDIEQLSESIYEHEMIIELLEKTEKTFSGLTWDIKNMVSILQMEQQ